MTRPLIAFDLMTNAKDSFRRAIELLAHAEIGTEHAQLKHAIMSSAHCIELMLKERLRRVHPAFIWESIDKCPKLDARTVTAEQAVVRLKNLANVCIGQKDEQTLRTLRITRNTIEHYEWHASVVDARVIVGKSLSFAILFASEHLALDLAQPFMLDDTWKTLLNDLFEFTSEHGARLEERLSEGGIPAVPCRECGATTVSLLSGECSLCGNIQYNDDDGMA